MAFSPASRSKMLSYEELTAAVAGKIAKGETPTAAETREYLMRSMEQRVLFLDGGMGTRIQAEGLEEEDFRGTLFPNPPKDLKGNNDLLCLSKPDLMTQIHEEYLDAGSDIIETNTFNGTSISQLEYGCQDEIRAINLAAAKLAKEATKNVTLKDMSKPRFVAGAIGPTSRTLTVSPSVEDPSFRNVHWDELVTSYKEELSALVDGGVDLLMIETIFDTQNAKAAIAAVMEYFDDTNQEMLPVMISGTIVDLSGRTLSGQTIEAFYISIRHLKPLTVGINCALGATQMVDFYTRLCNMCEGFVHIYPNAGLPNAMGGYDDTPADFSKDIAECFAGKGLLNVVGGCCGTFPSHIKAVVEKLSAENTKPRAFPKQITDKSKKKMMLSGLEPWIDDGSFCRVGERCNLMGSIKFRKLIEASKWDDGLEICKEQVEAGCEVLDFNFDADLIDGKDTMGKFLRFAVTEPQIAQKPFMIDSSKFDVCLEGLKTVQGKCIMNSISLKPGEDEFKRQAKELKKYGCAIVVMAFDEEGQAATYGDKVRICKRSYDILTGPEIGWPGEDIIFDCNVLTIATGLEEHNGYGLDYINAVKTLHEMLPEVSFSGGLSNLSFSFRGMNHLREAMHCVMLHHGTPLGLNMSIVNPIVMLKYEELEPQLRLQCDEVLLNKSDDGNHVERFLEMAEEMKRKLDEEKARKKKKAEKKEATSEEQSSYLKSLQAGADKKKVEYLDDLGERDDLCMVGITPGQSAEDLDELTKKLADQVKKLETPSPHDILTYFNLKLRKEIMFLDGGMGEKLCSSCY